MIVCGRCTLDGLQNGLVRTHSPCAAEHNVTEKSGSSPVSVGDFPPSNAFWVQIQATEANVEGTAAAGFAAETSAAHLDHLDPAAESGRWRRAVQQWTVVTGRFGVANGDGDHWGYLNLVVPQ